MKKKFVIIISSLLILSLGGCSSKPSEEKIKSALDEGTITVRLRRGKRETGRYKVPHNRIQ